MPPFLYAIFLFLLTSLQAFGDMLTGRKKRRYEQSIFVNAPRDLVWGIAGAKSITFDDGIPMEITSDTDLHDPSLYIGKVKIGDHETVFRYRVVEERPAQALLMQMLPADAENKTKTGPDHFAAVTLLDDGQGTRLTLAHELTHQHIMTRWSIPMGVNSTVRRMKRRAEKDAGQEADTFAESVRDALITGALTLANFAYLFGWSAAVMLVFLILIHELGHVVGMKWCNIPVKGIYFIPFFGGVAIGNDRYKDEAQRGLVAFMGPGFCLIPTAAFWAAGAATGEEIWTTLAVMSAFLNGLNLLPVMPLDGGHIADSLVSRLDPDIADMVHLGGLLLGFGLAIYMKWYLLGFSLLFQIPRVFSGVPNAHRLPPLTPGQTVLLLIAYAGALLFYAAIVQKVVL